MHKQSMVLKASLCHPSSTSERFVWQQLFELFWDKFHFLHSTLSEKMSCDDLKKFFEEKQNKKLTIKDCDLLIESFEPLPDSTLMSIEGYFWFQLQIFQIGLKDEFLKVKANLILSILEKMASFLTNSNVVVKKLEIL